MIKDSSQQLWLGCLPPDEPKKIHFDRTAATATVVKCEGVQENGAGPCNRVQRLVAQRHQESSWSRLLFNVSQSMALRVLPSLRLSEEPAFRVGS